MVVQGGAATALDSVEIPHCGYADDIALTLNTAENLQLQLNKYYDYTGFKGLKLNTDKTKVMVFFSSSTFTISCHAQLLAVTIRVIWLVGFSLKLFCLVSFNKLEKPVY